MIGLISSDLNQSDDWISSRVKLWRGAWCEINKSSEATVVGWSGRGEPGAGAAISNAHSYISHQNTSMQNVARATPVPS